MDLEENAFFDMDTAVPLGIIVNELISNSLKYAFSDCEKGEIRIALNRIAQAEDCRGMRKSRFCLEISDSGRGIPEALEIENVDSLGLQLVATLVEQLDGDIELKKEKGTEFRITFNVSETWVLPINIVFVN